MALRQGVEYSTQAADILSNNNFGPVFGRINLGKLTGEFMEAEPLFDPSDYESTKQKLLDAERTILLRINN